jgi:iron complex outermembrane receptor protein
MHVMYPLKRDSVYFDGRFKITDNVNFRTELGYNQREARQIAGYPLQSSTAGVGSMSIDSYFNPFGRQHGYATPTAVAWNRRTWEVPRVTTSELKTYRAVASFDGSFEIGSATSTGKRATSTTATSWNPPPATCTRARRRRRRSVVLQPATGKVECGTAAPISYDVQAVEPAGAVRHDDPTA